MNSRRPWLSGLAALVGLMLSLCVAVAPAQAATPPTDLHGVSRTQVRIQMAWTATDGATHFQLRYATKSDFSDARVIKPIAGPTRTLTGLKPGTLYYFRVGATDASGNATSGWSATATYPTRPLMKISVGTFNVKDPGSDNFGSWATRADRSAKVIVDQGVRLIGLQELYESRQDYLDRINRFANLAGKGRPYQMTSSPSCDDSCGNDNRIVFDSTLYTLLDQGAFKYSKQYWDPDKNDGAGGYESPRMLVWAKLQHMPSGQLVMFVSTHLSPSSDAVDVSQWKQLVTWLNKQRTADPRYKFIVTGDFNTTKFEAPATMLSVMRSNGYEDVLGQVARSWSATYRNPSQRVDAWICSSNGGKRDVRAPKCTAPSTSQNAGSINYIFVSRALKVPYYRVYAQPRTGYTMNYLTSDHFLVRAIISQ